MPSRGRSEFSTVTWRMSLGGWPVFTPLLECCEFADIESNYSISALLVGQPDCVSSMRRPLTVITAGHEVHLLLPYGRQWTSYKREIYLLNESVIDERKCDQDCGRWRALVFSAVMRVLIGSRSHWHFWLVAGAELSSWNMLTAWCSTCHVSFYINCMLFHMSCKCYTHCVLFHLSLVPCYSACHSIYYL